jgi:hypothetical protein
MSKQPEKEIYPDAWSRFERAVDVVAKSPPQHRAKVKKSPKKKKEDKKKRKQVGLDQRPTKI